jgi:pyruvate dehydrogenase E2 component (dihydrolipoyllysine-residue acetyltransferase)
LAEVTLPQLGETVTEGTITQWFKAVGDNVNADEPLFEVSTDKVDTEVPSPVAGTVAEIRVPEGETVSVGTVIAVVNEGGEAPAAAPAAESGAATPEAATPEAATPEAATPEAAPAAEAPVAQAEPAPAAEAPVAQAEPAPAAEAPAVEAQPAPGPEPAPPAPAPEPAAPAGTTEPAAAPAEPATVAAAPQAPAPQPTVGEAAPSAAAGRLLSPVVRRLVNEHGLDPASITGTGPGGRITRDDVLDHIDAIAGGKAAAPAAAPAAPAAPPAPVPPAAPAAPTAPTAPAAPAAPAAAVAPAAAAPKATDRDEAVKLSKIRKLTGTAMLASKNTSPHAFSVVEVDYHNVDVTRTKVKDHWKAAEGFSLTYLPFISRAVVDALVEFPHLNAAVGENELIVHGYVDLGIAVDLDYGGLIVPVIRGAEGKRLGAIAKEIHDLADRARTKKLLPDEIAGGTFTISNNGSAGSVLTFPIINQPQVAILSTDAIVRKPVVAALPDGTEAIVVHPLGKLAMAWDHRAFDGAYAAGFLVRVKQILETKDWGTEL